jgi:hypothetical protein
VNIDAAFTPVILIVYVQSTSSRQPSNPECDHRFSVMATPTQIDAPKIENVAIPIDLTAFALT